MAASPDLLLAVALCFLLRLAGHEQPIESHPVLASFFKVDALYDRAWRELKRLVPVNWPRKLGRRKHATMINDASLLPPLD